MKKILYSFLSIIVLAASAQVSPREEAAILQRMIQELHYSPLQLSDSICEKIALLAVEELDPKKIYFNTSDIQKIKSRSFILTKDLIGKSWEFVPFLSNIYTNALNQSRIQLEEFAKNPIDLKRGDTLKPSSKLGYCATSEELKRRRSNYFKHLVLLRLYAIPDSVAKVPALLSDLESKARSRVQKVELRKMSAILEYKGGVEQYLLNKILNSYTTMLDAHSVYLPRELFESLRGQLDTEELSYGMELKENEEGEIAIYRVVPGGSAWKTNELFKEDILISIRSTGKTEEFFDGLELNEAEQLLDLSNEIVLTVKEASGRIKKVPLKKERIRKEDNKVKGIVLTGEKKIGYISLPGFYTEWENSESSGCSNDVAKEILKLKEEGIEGIILDIRYNGGGSLMEGMNMAGIFINEGPLYLKKERDQKIQVIKDQNRGTVYDGPLVVMMNGQSASASEVLAAVLQDYNRAVLVGSRTYGKATGQLILPVDTNKIAGLISFKGALHSEHGYTLLTTQKLFRITGKTAQIKGVLPDIELPDYMDGFQEREEQKPTALPSEEVIKKVYYTPLPAKNLEIVRANSQKRVSEGSIGKIPSLLTQYWALPEDKVLNLQYYKMRNKEYFTLWEKLESVITTQDSVFECENTLEMKQILEIDEYQKDNNTFLKGNLKSDAYLIESYKIICDIINQQ
jgi:carboxyl-terminal processing protease